jgi:hypothetical protein
MEAAISFSWAERKNALFFPQIRPKILNYFSPASQVETKII